MKLLDVNVLVEAHREDSLNHEALFAWLSSALMSVEGVAVSELVLSGFLRVVTHPRVFRPPSPLDASIEFTAQIREHPNVTILAPGARHWSVFTRLCRSGDARGNLVSDAYHAALAIEHGCTWISCDRDFARFPGLDWRHPLTHNA